MEKQETPNTSAAAHGSAFPDEPCEECGVNTLKLLQDNADLKKRDRLWKRLCKKVSKERDILFNQGEMLRSELATTTKLLAEKNETANTFMRQIKKLQADAGYQSEICPVCGGDGYAEHDYENPQGEVMQCQGACKRCNGRGRVRKPQPTPNDRTERPEAK